MASASMTCALAALLLLAGTASAQGLTDGEGQAYDLRSLRGQVVAITFASPPTREEAGRVNLALEAHVQPREVAVVSVIDISHVPSLMHGYARRQVAEHQRHQRIKLLVTTESNLRQSLRVQSDRMVYIMVVDREGQVRGRFGGEGELPRALQLMDELRKAAPPQAVALR